MGSGGYGRHSGGFLLRIMPPSWHPVPACTPRLRCRRAVLLCDDEDWNRTRHRSGNVLPQAGRSTCRHDNAASILDFKPRLANRCSKEVKTRAIRASILDFKPRLANRCSQKSKTGANRASILDFRPRLANPPLHDICASIYSTGVWRFRGYPNIPAG